MLPLKFIDFSTFLYVRVPSWDEAMRPDPHSYTDVVRNKSMHKSELFFYDEIRFKPKDYGINGKNCKIPKNIYPKIFKYSNSWEYLSHYDSKRNVIS